MQKHRQSVVSLGAPLNILMAVFIASQTARAAAPAVASLNPTNVSNTGASLRLTVNPNASSTTVWFEWGAGATFNHNTSATAVGAGTAAITNSALISGLTSGTAYHYRGVASNALGVVRGTATTFGVPTVVLTGSNPVSIAQGAAFSDPGATVNAGPTFIASGFNHSLAAKADGTVAGWGNDDDYQVTIPSSATNAIAVAAGSSHSLALRVNGTVVGWGFTNDGAITIPPEATNVIAIAAGRLHSLALTSGRQVLAWGDDGDGQIDVPAQVTNIIAIAAGQRHNLALQASGNVIAWGSDSDGQSTVPDTATNGVVAVAAGGNYSLALKANGTIIHWGATDNGQDLIPATATNGVIAIAAGFRHCLALKSNGTLVGWGNNDDGQINIPNNATNVIAMAGGVFHSIALKADGSVVSWGLNDRDQTNTSAGLNQPAISVNVSGNLNSSVPGNYPLLYKATNSLGFVGTATRNVIVVGSDPIIGSLTVLSNNAAKLAINFTPGASLTVLATTNLSLPSSNWTVLGVAMESPAGYFQYTDLGATNFSRRFYRVRTP